MGMVGVAEVEIKLLVTIDVVLFWLAARCELKVRQVRMCVALDGRGDKPVDMLCLRPDVTARRSCKVVVLLTIWRRRYIIRGAEGDIAGSKRNIASYVERAQS